MEKIKQILENLGFDKRETQIYLLLLKEGSLPALQIARKTQIDRTTIYDILEKLSQRGIISSYTENNSKKFKAISPKALLINFKEKYSSLEKILPELNKLSSQKTENLSCEIFQGKEGLKTPLKELILRRKDYKVINIRNEFEEVLSYFNDQGVLKLNEFNAKEIAIVEKETKFKRLKNGTYRYLNKELISPTTTLLYDDIVVFFIWSEPYWAIKIKNKIFAKTQEEYFNLLWKLAKK